MLRERKLRREKISGTDIFESGTLLEKGNERTRWMSGRVKSNCPTIDEKNEQELNEMSDE